MNVSTSDNSPTPRPPQGSATAERSASAEDPAAEPEAVSPVMPAAGSNRIPQLAGVNPHVYVAPKMMTRRRSRSKVYGIGTMVFIAIAAAGYFGFRSYIYGDDGPPVPVLDDLGG